MKLRDLVANSLPRVRGRKKKTPTSACAAASTVEVAAKSEVAAKAEVATGRSSLDKNKNKLQLVTSKHESRVDNLEAQGIAEANWRGNALYRGLEAARAVQFNSKLMSSSYTSSHGMVTSHSAEGFSSQMMMMSRSYDSRMTVPDCSDSCPQMLSVCESGEDPFSSPQQYYHCHYHQHSHHHYHLQHLHPTPMAPLAQNQQKLYSELPSAKCLTACKGQEEAKSQPGFFRKSFASFRSYRKQNSKNRKDLEQSGNSKTACSVCPHPEIAAVTLEKKSADKRPVKPKRKSLKGLSKHKENKDAGQSDKSWFSDNDTKHGAVGTEITRVDSGLCVPVSRQRQHEYRERSVESCSSRIFGSREGSCVREIDFTGFDSASLSGYESDLPRGKVHRSRSRIKTNPWLPSPQPSMSGGSRSKQFDLRESTEDFVRLEDFNAKFPRSASFECQRSRTALVPFQKDADEGHKMICRPRSVTPSDNKGTHSLKPREMAKSCIVKPRLWPVSQEKKTRASSKSTPQITTDNFNDLNSNVARSRPTSMVSPNSEFVMLADNLEQLANNISFEYEEMLDTTLESVSLCQEDGQTPVHDFFTDDENGDAPKTTCLKSGAGDVQSAHSPDSGVGGLDSNDGDENLGSSSHRLQEESSVRGVPHSGSVRSFDNRSAIDLNLDLRVCSKVGYSQRDKPGADSKCQSYLLDGFCDYNTQIGSPKLKTARDKLCLLDNSSSTTQSESDIDNTSYHDVVSCRRQKKELNDTKAGGMGLPAKEHNSFPGEDRSGLDGRGRSSTLMVDERLDIQVHPVHRQIHGCGIIMGIGGSMHDHGLPNGGPGKQVMWKCQDSSTLVNCRHQRPCAFRTNQGQVVRRKMNDIEKSSGEGQQRRSWSVEFDIPRNITITECVESPTENWQCVDGFSLGRHQENVAPNQTPQHKSVPDHQMTDGSLCDNDNSFLKHEELFVNLADVVAFGSCKHRRNKPEVGIRPECSYENLNMESDSACSETNDACVQTDFDEDFSKWEDHRTLESLESKSLDPAESTRLWLLTGSMQDSADTGYSSLTRESQILMDEDTLFLAGEIEETAAAERLSYIESSSDKLTAVDAASGNNSDDAENNGRCTEKIQPPGATGWIVDKEHSVVDKEHPIVKKEHIREENEKVKNMDSKKKSPPKGLALLSGNSREQTSHVARSIPQRTVKQMFSSIESQFEEILQKIYNDKSNVNSATKRTSSDSSDSTLKSSDADDFQDGATSENILGRRPEVEKAGTKAGGSVGVGKERGCVNKTSPGSVSKESAHNESKNMGLCVRNVPDLKYTSLGNAKCKPVLQPRTREINPIKNAIVRSPPVVTSPLPVAHERADYLEFLRDAPLNRLHLKRPLFLVPGVGPVDMSSSEQINLFAETEIPCSKNSVPSGALSSLTSPVTSSPAVVHCGKKLKYKKAENNLVDLSRSSSRAKQSASMFSPLSSNLPSLPKRQDQPTLAFINKDYATGNSSAHASSVHCGKRNPDLVQKRSIKCVVPPGSQSSLSPPPPPPPPLSSSLSTTTATTTKPFFVDSRPAEERQNKEAAIRNMAERVICLQREKDMVFRKIQEVRQDERLRQQHHLQHQQQHQQYHQQHQQRVEKHLQNQRKEALLETLNDLKHKLEEQSKLLTQKDDSKGEGV